MINVPIWVFIMLVVGFSFSVIFIICGIIQVIHDEIIDYVKWKTNYNKYKEFWDDNSELR